MTEETPQEQVQVTVKPPSSLEVVCTTILYSLLSAPMGAVVGVMAGYIAPTAIRGSMGLCKRIEADNLTLATELKNGVAGGKIGDEVSHFLAIHLFKAMYSLSLCTAPAMALTSLTSPEYRNYGLVWLATNALSGIGEIGRALYNRGYRRGVETPIPPQPSQ